MAVRHLTKVIQHLRTSTFHDEADASDGQLLDQFLEHQDESAFATLVRRHGSMVWGVCRRVLAHHQDAEDAFQATFLVLARKGHAVRPRAMVGNWLFGVAQRTALKARGLAARRQMREKQVTSMPEPEAVEQGAVGTLEPLIDQELAHLPDKYRGAIVLCDLEGKTIKAAAHQLNLPAGTLATRLRTGRVMLAKRLARHGLTLSGGALATALAQHAALACAPHALVTTTIKAATLMAAGKTAAAGLISANAIALTEGALRTMLLTKLKTVLTALVLLAMTGVAGALLTRGEAAERLVNAPDKAGPLSQSTDEEPGAVPAQPHALRKASGRAAPSKSAAAPSDAGKVRTVVYSVADLVVPIPGLDVPHVPAGSKKGATKEEWLIDKITRTVAPDSWEGFGGKGSIQYFPLGMSLTVRNTPRVQAQVLYLLETMRRVQDVQVAVETRIVALNAASFRKLQTFLPQLKKSDHAVLSGPEVFALLRKAQDDADTKVTQAPKITFFPGQRVCLAIDPSEESGKVDLKLTAMVAANLQDVELDVKGAVNKMEFAKAVRLLDGATLAQFKRVGDGYLGLLVTPRVILSLGEDAGASESPPPPRAKTPKSK